MKFTSLKEANAALAEKSKKLHEVFEAAGPDMDMSKTFAMLGVADTAAAAAKIREMNEELADIGKQRDEFQALEDARTNAEREYDHQHRPGGGITHPKDGDRPQERKSLGKLLVESKEYGEYKGLRNWPMPLALPNFNIRAAVFRTNAGFDPQDIRERQLEKLPLRPLAVIDFVPVLPTSQSSVVYMEQTTFTQAAAETAESTATTAADLIPEAAIQYTERTQPVEWLPVFLPVTMQQLEDAEGIEAEVDNDLTYAVQARLDLQILQGNGTTPNLLGTNSKTGIQTTAKGTDPTPDAVYKTFRKIRADGFAEPSVLFAHPNDWEDVRLLRTADGLYIWGNPSEAGPDRIWGVQVVQTTAALENTMTTGDYARYAQVRIKRGIEIAVSDSHAHYFTRGMLAIRADMRVAVVHRRPKAFGTITGV